MKKILFVFMCILCFTSVAYAEDNDEVSFDELINEGVYIVYQNDVLLDEFACYNDALEYAKKWENATLTVKGILWHNYKDKKEVLLEENSGNSILLFDEYKIYQNDVQIGVSQNFDSATKYAEKYANSFVYGTIVLWDNYAPYFYWRGEERFFCESIADYIGAKKENPITSPLYTSKNGVVVYEYENNCNHKISNVKCISQKPELPRGCEVTSLAMMFDYNGFFCVKNVVGT